MNTKKIVVAIDGHSSCGKSTMAKQLAKQVGYIYVDTGAMYRAAALFALRRGFLSPDGTLDEDALRSHIDEADIAFRLDPESGAPRTLLCGEDVEGEIRGMQVSAVVSRVAALPFVREKLTREQQRMGEQKGIVMDGRDIGTAVFPNAELKVFITARPEVRAQRRFDELKAKGQPADFDEILKNVQERDYADSHRAVNPLRQAEDALLLDNSDLTREEQSEWLLEKFREKIEED